MSSMLRLVVVGSGSLGKEHARIYSELAKTGLVEFIGVYDTIPEVGAEVARRYRVKPFDSLEEAMKSADAASIVTPTATHYQVAKQFLEQGKHLLIEKPITANAAEAEELVRLAKEQDCLLQVGHVERFNPVLKYLQHAATQPRFIEVHRLSPFLSRSTDIGVVLDLMIHDLDIVLAFVKSPVSHVDAVGVPVLSASEDIANARIRFANGCVANLTASRVSPERVRKIRVFSGGQDRSYVSLDYRQQEGYIYRIAREGEEKTSVLKKLLAPKEGAIVSAFGGKQVVREPVPLEKEEPLKLELESFVSCLQAKRTPVVSGENAMWSLELALQIVHQINRA